MPGKHVRFSRSNTVHTFSPSPFLSPPSLSHGGHSPASTSSLSTPPDLPVPLPPTSHHSHKRSQSVYHSSSLRLHRLLEDSLSPELLYDVRLPPSSVGAKRRAITPEEFNEPATSPRTSSMTVRHQYLPWSIQVTPSGYSRSRGMHYITVWDVLKAVHTGLRTPIRQADYDRLGTGSRHQNRVRKAYEDRYKMQRRNPAAYEEEKLGGVKRVDFLVEYVRFMGLVPHNVEMGEFMLHTES